MLSVLKGHLGATVLHGQTQPGTRVARLYVATRTIEVYTLARFTLTPHPFLFVQAKEHLGVKVDAPMMHHEMCMSS